MAQAKVTSKGQITIPAELRRELGLRPGDTIEFFKDRDGIRVRKRFAENPFDKWVGYLKHLEGQRTDEIIEEMRGP